MIEQIKREANRLKAKFHTTDPFEICTAMKVHLLMEPMGTGEGACKGFFFINARRKVITVNSDLPEYVQRVILAHELGHATLHSQQPFSAFHDISMLDKSNRQEFEANVFASEFLLDDDEVICGIEEGTDFFWLASYLQVPPEMLDFKLQLLSKQGYPIDAPCIAKSTFLKRNIDEPLN